MLIRGGNKMSGWIKLHRAFLNWEWYDDVNTKILFIHCLLKANHMDKKWRGFNIERGSFVTSINNLSTETSLSNQQVRTSLAKLENTGEVTRQATKHFTKLSICNYGTYQNDEKINNTPVNKQVTNEQQTSNKRVTTTKERKKEKKEENKGIQEVLNYLNEKTKKNYRVARGLQSRFNEGYTVDDAKMVIDIKCNEWLNDDKMRAFLRPETLFSGKFDTYLNQEPVYSFPQSHLKQYTVQNEDIWVDIDKSIVYAANGKKHDVYEYLNGMITS
jgi:uncharacterized phage protein (TIGR02220 family)